MKVLVTEPITAEGIDILSQQADVDVKLGLRPEELISLIGDYEALMVRSETKVTQEVIKSGKKLQVIARAGVGVDNIDLDAATQRGIVVVNVPTANTIAAAEHTIALMLALARHIPQAHTHLKGGAWQRNDFVGVEIRNKTLGIIGLGNVGSEVARRVQSLQMKVIAHDPFISPEYAHNLRVELVSLESLLKESDFITLHLPLTPSARGLIGSKELSLVKPSVRIINCARGVLINEQALLKAIEEGRVAGAALDVFSEEPPVNNPLLKNEKVIVTPHLGASTEEAQVTVATDAAQQVAAVLSGQPARYAVNAPLIPFESLSFLDPFVNVASVAARVAAQLAEGQASSIDIAYEGEIADYDLTVLKVAVLGSLLEEITEERVSIVNVNIVAQRRGVRVTEHTNATCENYASLITVSVTTSAGVTAVAATVMRGELHIVRVNDYWVDLVPKGAYFLFSDHRDRPGLIGAVGMVTGDADININSMQVSRLKPRGQALMVLELDEPLKEEYLQQILSIADVYTARVVKL
ncbi:MAG: phosphoglycerate dehydrogenase [Dehalococcoidia bacterium]|nr:phosphoglycerate dehydrogenase [Dehalococcoidia bacterium]